MYFTNVNLSCAFNSLNSGICLKKDKSLTADTERALICCNKVFAYDDGFQGRPSRAAK